VKCWKVTNIHGRAAYVMKEKLKKLKSCLKLWNKETYGNLQKLAKEILVKINDLDLKDEEGILSLRDLREKDYFKVRFGSYLQNENP